MEATQATSDGSLYPVVILGVLLLLWVVIMIILGMINARRAGRLKIPKIRHLKKHAKELSVEAQHKEAHAPAEKGHKPHHDDHAHGHGHGAGLGKALTFALVILALSISGCLIYFTGTFVDKPGAPSEVAYAYASRNGTLPGGIPPVNYGKQTLTVPPGPEIGSSLIDVPFGTDIHVSEPMSTGRYRIRCKDHAGHFSEWMTEPCGKNFDFIQFQAIGPEPFELEYQFQER